MVKKLVITKWGNHHWRKVPNISKEGLYYCEFDEGIVIFDNKRIVTDFGDLWDCILKYKAAYMRNIKIEEVLGEGQKLHNK